jgi:hypothetical protein
MKLFWCLLLFYYKKNVFFFFFSALTMEKDCTYIASNDYFMGKLVTNLKTNYQIQTYIGVKMSC